MDHLSAKTIKISGGNIEYTFAGQGPIVLVSHGTLGGFDQGLAVARLFDQDAFRFLAVSRAGYLRSSPGTGRTPEEQARSYAELLDREGIESAAVMGLSGGSPSALYFAQDYPDRCWALVLISSTGTALPPLPLSFRLVLPVQVFLMRFDLLWSLAYRYGVRAMARSNGATPEQIERVFGDPLLQQVLSGIYRPVRTSSARRAGFCLDDRMMKSLPGEPDYTVRVPTYIVHAANDPMAPAANAARLAAAIPGAGYYELPDGGHVFFVVHREKVVPGIERFLEMHAPGASE